MVNVKINLCETDSNDGWSSQQLAGCTPSIDTAESAACINESLESYACTKHIGHFPSLLNAACLVIDYGYFRGCSGPSKCQSESLVHTARVSPVKDLLHIHFRARTDSIPIACGYSINKVTE